MRLREDVEKLRRILLEHSDGLSWGELIEKTGWGPSVLKSRIDFTERRAELTTKLGKRRGRRTTLYMLADLEKSRAESAKYDSIKFIENLRNPLYSFKSSKDRKATVSLFITPERGRATMKMASNLMAAWGLKGLQPWAKSLEPGQKMALIVTLEN